MRLRLVVMAGVALLLLPGVARANGLGALAGLVSAAFTCLVVSTPLVLVLVGLMVAPAWVDMSEAGLRSFRWVAMVVSAVIPLAFLAVILFFSRSRDHWGRKGLVVAGGFFGLILLVLAGISFYRAFTV
ncbi:MAG: hypothetical protein JXR96_29505 [Deltaproteobacteria bacterium]|nr:hypothetical protein [Deltaproteobacteria bacterium]